MTADEIRNLFAWNNIHGSGTGTDTERMALIALGEVAAQLADINETLRSERIIDHGDASWSTLNKL